MIYKENSWVFRIRQDPFEAECVTCKAVIYMSVSNKCASNLEAHSSSAKHKIAAKGKRSSGKLTDYFLRPGKTDDAVTAAEGVFAYS